MTGHFRKKSLYGANDKGLTLETSAYKLFTVANLRSTQLIKPNYLNIYLNDKVEAAGPKSSLGSTIVYSIYADDLETTK